MSTSTAVAANESYGAVGVQWLTMGDGNGKDARLSENVPTEGPARGGEAAEPVAEVTYNETRKRFEAHLAGSDDTAFIDVRPGAKTWAFVHTEVPPSFRGRGVGSMLVSAALDHVRELGVKVRPLCPFVLEYLREHPEVADVVEPRSRKLL